VIEMKVLVVGGTGTIGAPVVEALRAAGHTVQTAERGGGDLQVDMREPDSIRAMLATAGPLDAIVSCAGSGAWKPLAELTDEDFETSLHYKLMGQVNLARLGADSLRDGGSVTLTSGVLAQEPMPGSAAISLVNAGLEGFARAAALEAPRGIRVNVVSPPWVTETLQAMGMDPSGGLPAEVVALAYHEAVTGNCTGEVLDARRFA
jgi:NAD(P)-dependent dehydrogenase (short-subunit alcohol dehydrogenase family)